MPAVTRSKNNIIPKRPPVPGGSPAATRQKREPPKIDPKNPCASLKIGQWVTIRNEWCCIMKLYPEKTPQKVLVVYPSAKDKSLFVHPEGRELRASSCKFPRPERQHEINSYNVNLIHALRRGNLTGEAVPKDKSFFKKEEGQDVDDGGDTIEIVDSDEEEAALEDVARWTKH